MNPNFFQLLLNSSGAALVTGLFIWYLKSRDKKDSERDIRFDTIIQDYLKESNDTKQQLAERMQRMTDVLENLEKAIFKRNRAVIKTITKVD